jgi:hypothetical protein
MNSRAWVKHRSSRRQRVCPASRAIAHKRLMMRERARWTGRSLCRRVHAEAMDPPPVLGRDAPRPKHSGQWCVTRGSRSGYSRAYGKESLHRCIASRVIRR